MSAKAYPNTEKPSGRSEMVDKKYQEDFIKYKEIGLSKRKITENEVKRMEKIRKWLEE